MRIIYDFQGTVDGDMLFVGVHRSPTLVSRAFVIGASTRMATTGRNATALTMHAINHLPCTFPSSHSPVALWHCWRWPSSNWWDRTGQTIPNADDGTISIWIFVFFFYVFNSFARISIHYNDFIIKIRPEYLSFRWGKPQSMQIVRSLCANIIFFYIFIVLRTTK